MRIKSLWTIPLLAAVAATTIVVPLSAGHATDESPVKVEAEILRQKYCASGNDTYTIKFTVRTRFTNQSDHKIILTKAFGDFLLDGAIASDANSLASGKYEFKPHYEVNFQRIRPETPEQFNSPDSSFAILAPGESLRDAGYFWAMNAAALPGSTSRFGLQPGDHVLDVYYLPWLHDAKPEAIHKKWEPIGDLIYKTITTGPIPFHLPADPKLENCNSGLDNEH
jgi:hypothetical protein